MMGSVGGSIRTAEDEYTPLGAMLSNDALRVMLGDEWRELVPGHVHR